MIMTQRFLLSFRLLSLVAILYPTKSSIRSALDAFACKSSRFTCSCVSKTKLLTSTAANGSSAGINATIKAGPQPGTLTTTWEEVTYDDAVAKENNMLQKLTCW